MWLKIRWLIPAETGTAALCPSLYVPEPDLSFKNCVIRNLWFVFLKGSLYSLFPNWLWVGGRRLGQMPYWKDLDCVALGECNQSLPY